MFTVHYYTIKGVLKTIDINDAKGPQDAIAKAKVLDKDYHRLLICQKVKD